MAPRGNAGVIKRRPQSPRASAKRSATPPHRDEDNDERFTAGNGCRKAMPGAAMPASRQWMTCPRSSNSSTQSRITSGVPLAHCTKRSPSSSESAVDRETPLHRPTDHRCCRESAISATAMPSAATSIILRSFRRCRWRQLSAGRVSRCTRTCDLPDQRWERRRRPREAR